MKQTNEKKISIIVPAYNCESYIEECIESLLNQTYKNIEIIIVNDGSTDKTKEVINKYKNEKRIKLYNQENAGANAARKKGIDESTGDYCVFVDADDWLDLECVQTLVNIVNKRNYDVVKFLGIMEPSKKIKNSWNFNGKKKTELEYPNIYEILIMDKALHNLCFSLYKKELLIDNEALSSSLSNCEDYWANLEIYSKKPKTVIINEVLYHYRSNYNSTTRTREKNKAIKNLNETLFVYSKLLEYISKWKINNRNIELKTYFAIMDSTRASIYSLLYVDDFNKKEIVEIINKTLNSDTFKIIRDNTSWKEIKRITKIKSLFYRIKNNISMKSIYYGKANSLYINRYLMKLYKLFNK